MHVRRFSSAPRDEFCRADYVAVPTDARLDRLAPHERLYIGTQTQDLMFRGDGLAGDNFHHADMRRGRGADNLEAYLRHDGEVKVYRIATIDIHALAKADPELHLLHLLMQQPLPRRAHQGWWLEQYVLHHEHPSWRWNQQGAASSVARWLSNPPPP
ncbi:hypothetical protein C1702_15005 [Caldimonas thermodepolymerans]|uniref:Uncharacterized protein n=3 Tax=Caldimonas thermodepolymerans TaxID=215580 RepID=A0A2S5T1G4_9BURK|nr:hypothetical protein C1702_15005 [Caldimonas thermodepolymerans]